MLHHPAGPHDQDVVGNLPDHRQIMADEQIRQTQVGLQIGQQIQDLCLHQYVERRHRFVAHQYLRAQRQRTRDRYPLPLTTRQLTGPPAQYRRRQRHLIDQLTHRPLPLPAVTDVMDA
ncbi:Uncharacterised protein [Mycobacterium tuberculosis]|uniref:Uncharacterized protein n=2 Tax=Mycobacterium tuberculosis TaxID=1773 RepID=A0A0T7PKV5_MYCTX|nr:Uncharacterised protein [Mycobacterium tuberculosis]CFE58351.1 Uncharacterised protein [Mycobacterium tuberculosis]CFS03324.1 Uncharacterised protein [Mycobacterium tuberculosis]CNT91928.1 Uncharacterised protein [Mycobacterium tuberculosis]CNT94316.1 Uncharacterised protein [Mycobacterium tuberculosis]